jgi:hypothetical protein
MLQNTKILSYGKFAEGSVKGTILLLVVLHISCGIFQPRDTFEVPVVTVAVDRFNFTSIFDSINKPFEWKNYETFFADSFKFSDSRTGIYGKIRFIEGLQQLTRKYEKFKINWSNIDKPNDGDVTTLTINELKYTFTVDTQAVEKQIYTGKSRMVILWDGTYKLIAWDDFPEVITRSIFAPE